jgi:hypothetical protein
MPNLRNAFDERLEEIDTYLDFLEGVEQEVRNGTPRLGQGGLVITARQQRILYSSVYLQLYNLVEATITKCLDAVCTAAMEGGRWRPGDLSTEMRREWVRFTARTHVTLTDENRLRHALELVEQLVSALPVTRLKVEKSGGNWDDEQIEGVASRIGLRLQITRSVYQGIKRKIRDDKGALALIAGLRNDLAHGSLSFAECGAGVLVAELRELKDKTALYLGEVVDAFEVWISSYEFLVPNSRPAQVAR